MFKQVKQDDKTGCGLACVALLARSTYKKQKAKATNILEDWPYKPNAFYTNEKQIKALLKENDIQHGYYRKEDDWSKIKTDIAIVAINRKNDRWHWVVYFRNKTDAYMIDSNSKKERRTDFGRARLHAYLPIYIETTN